MSKEIFKDIPYYEGMYQVSNLGRVKSLSRLVGHNLGGLKMLNGRILKPGLSTSGYKVVVLRKDNQSKTNRVHQLVAMSFLGHIPCRYKLIVDHIDNNPLNNKLDNLQLVTNRHNSSKDKHKIKSSSKYIGVCWHKGKNRWYASITINKKNVHLGSFTNELEAAKAYQDKLKTIC